MTIIAAYEDPNAYWIASDSVGTQGNLTFNLGSKLITKGNYILGFAWSYRVADIIKECDLPDKLNNIKDLRRIRDAIKEALSEDTIIEVDNGTHPLSLVIISPSGIFTIEDDYQIHRMPDKYVACGSGTAVALGCLYTCAQMEIDGKTSVILAVKAAMEHISSCGGKCFVKSITKK